MIVKGNIREQRLQKLTEFLRANTYPEGIITKGIEKAKGQLLNNYDQRNRRQTTTRFFMCESRTTQKTHM